MTMKTYTGSCHCGAVNFSVETEFASVIQCNCSICHKHGLVLTFVPLTQFHLLSGEDNLTEYTFNTMRIAHQFCRICGVEPFGKGKNKEGEETRAVNVRCLDDVDFSTLTITPFNGKDM
jgi:hypothetical protein